MAEDGPGEVVDTALLAQAIEGVLARHPGSTAREILKALPADLQRGASRRDINSVLYRGAGTSFIRSDDEKPRWRLSRTRSGEPAPQKPAPQEKDERVAARRRRRVEESSAPRRSARTPDVPDAPDAPEPHDIARILFDD